MSAELLLALGQIAPENANQPHFADYSLRMSIYIFDPGVLTLGDLNWDRFVVSFCSLHSGLPQTLVSSLERCAEQVSRAEELHTASNAKSARHAVARMKIGLAAHHARCCKL